MIKRFGWCVLFVSVIALAFAMTPEMRKDTLSSKFDYCVVEPVEDCAIVEEAVVGDCVWVVDEIVSDSDDMMEVASDTVPLDSVAEDYDSYVYYDDIADNNESYLESPYISNKEDASRFAEFWKSVRLSNKDNIEKIIDELAAKGYPNAKFLKKYYDDSNKINDLKNAINKAGIESLSAEDLYTLAMWEYNYENYDDFKNYAEKAIEKGSIPASLLMASYLYNIDDGMFVPEKKKRILDLVEAGCRQNDSESLFYKACLYDEGIILPYSIKDNIKYLEKAAKLGNVKAMNNLGNVYATGYGGKKIDVKKDLELKNRAAEIGHPNVKLFLARIAAEHGDYEKAMKYVDEVVEDGKDNAYDSLLYTAIANSESDGLPVDFIKALYDKVLTNGLIESYTGDYGYILDLCNLSDSEWKKIEDDAAADDISSLKDLYLDSYYGIRSKKDYSKALQILEKMAALDNSYMKALAWQYVKQDGGRHDFDKSISVLEKLRDDLVKYETRGSETAIDYAAQVEVPDDYYVSTLQYNLFITSPEFETVSSEDIEEEISLLKELKASLSQYDELQKRAGKGDSEALYKIYQLRQENLIEDGSDNVNFANLLNQAAQGGYKDAINDLIGNWSKQNELNHAFYWTCKLQNLDPVKEYKKLLDSE